MDKIYVVDENNNKKEIEVVRYFNYINNKYLVYNLGELDDLGNAVLYITKIGPLPITEEEWIGIKQNVFNEIVRANKEGRALTVEDLDYNSENIMVKKDKMFRLPVSSVEDLGANKKVFNMTSNLNDTLENNSVNMFPNFSFQNSNAISDNNVDSLNSNINISNNNTNDSNIDNGITENIFNNSFSFNKENESSVNSNDLFDKNSSPFTEYNNITSYNDLVSSTVSSEMDYKKMYEEEKDKNVSLNNEINLLKAELDTYKEKISKLKQIIS